MPVVDKASYSHGRNWLTGLTTCWVLHNVYCWDRLSADHRAFTSRIDDRACLYRRDMSRPFQHRECAADIGHYISRRSVSTRPGRLAPGDERTYELATISPSTNLNPVS